MKKEQNVKLEPLSEDDAMVLLWRQIHVVELGAENDETVAKKIDELKVNKPVEYHALKELCGYEGSYSLGGLPLALVQAGTYIGRFECSFSVYLNLLKDANGKKELDGLLGKTHQLSPVDDAQRSILTTWRICVERLSDKAYEVLRSMALLGPGNIPEVIMKSILGKIGTRMILSNG